MDEKSEKKLGNVNHLTGFTNKMEGVRVDDLYKQLQNKTRILVYNSDGDIQSFPVEFYDSLKFECIVGVYDSKIAKKELYNDIKFVLNE